MINKFKTIAVIGLGYIGLPTAAVIASRGVNVIGVDVNQSAVDTINMGRIHIVEPDLEALVHEVVQMGKLRATTIPEPADAFLIAVPTPFKNDHVPDLSYVEAATKSIASVLKKGDLIILESTSPVGTTEEVARWLADARPDLSFPHQKSIDPDINIAYCPERVLPGKIVYELVNNARVIGGMTTHCSQRAIALYKVFVEAECIETNSRTAEMCKLTENSFRDVNIAFANELSIICEKLEINVWELIRLANRHPRVNVLQPGPGVGGHCIAVDPWFIVSRTPKEAKLIRAAREVNDSKPLWVLDKVKIAIAEFLQNNPEMKAKEVTISCFGLAFKPDIDDLRESPALAITVELAKLHPGPVLVVEPNITQLPPLLSTSVKLVTTEEAKNDSHIILMLVSHKEFRILPNSFWTSGVIIDACGLK